MSNQPVPAPDLFGSDIVRKPSAQTFSYNFNIKSNDKDVPEWLLLLARYVGLDVYYLSDCFLQTFIDDDGPYSRIYAMRHYLHNNFIHKFPYFNLEEVLSLPKREWLNLSSLYDLINKNQLSVSLVKGLTDEQRIEAINIWNNYFFHPKRNQMILAFLNEEQKNLTTHEDARFLNATSRTQTFFDPTSGMAVHEDSKESEQLEHGPKLA